MKNSMKRILSALLCFAMLLSYIPQMSVAQDAHQWITIEAEDTEYAVWNRYTKAENNTNASGGKQVGGAPSGTFARYDDPNSSEDLAGGFLDKSNSPYVAFYVEAPEDGTYKLSTAGSFWSTASYITNGKGEKYFSAFLVNGVAYRAYYPDADLGNGKYQITEEVDVTLKKGINTICVIPLTDDQDSTGNTNWANVDCLKVGGLQPVTAVKAQSQTLYAADAPYVHNYNRNADGVDGMIGGDNWDDTTVPIDSFQADDVDTYHAFTYTVTAPADGYYDITATYKNAGNAANRAVGLLVDGVPQAREYEHLDADRNKGGRVDLSVYLTAGDHVLTITAPAKRTADDTCGNNVSWFNYYELILGGGLTKAAVQSTANLKQKIIQANDTAYTLVNRFDNLASANANATDGLNVGGGHHGDNQSLTQLESFFDREKNTYVAFTLEAPQTGEYELVLRYVLNMSGVSNGTRFEAGQAYAIFLVNGKAYTADFGGTTGNYDSWMSDTPITVTLEKGINTVIAMPLTAEQMAFGGSATWADVDCLKVDARLEPLKVAETELKPGDSEYVNLYNTVNVNATGNAVISVAQAAALTVAGLQDENGSVDTGALARVPYVSYTVDVSEDGYYDLAQAFRGYLKNQTGYENQSSMALVVDGKVYEANYNTDSSGNGEAYWNVWLTAGTHVLTVTMQMPKTASGDSWKGYWTDLKSLYVSGEVTLSEKQRNPMTGSDVAELVLEAESDAFYNNFHKIEPETLSGATVIGYANTNNNPTLEELESQLAGGSFDKSNINYLGFMVEAPEDGEYYIKLRYKVNDATSGNAYAAQPYAAFLVNGEDLYTADFVGRKNNLGDSDYIKIRLTKGINTIYCMSLLKDLENALDTGWTQVDALIADGRLSKVEPAALELKANEAEYINLYTRNATILGNADSTWANIEGIYIGELSRSNLNYVPYFAYTVDVPADGFYDMTLYFNGTGASDTNAIGLVVDGVPQAAKYNYIVGTAASSGEHKADVSAYLTAGTHTLVWTMQLPVDADAAVSYTYRWTNMVKTVFHGGITLAQEQADPAEDVVLDSAGSVDGMIKLEAEEYAFFNNYHKVEPQEDMGSTVMGYANNAGNPTYAELAAQLEKDILDKNQLSYLGFMVEAPADGLYEVKLRYKINDDTAGAEYPETPFVAYIVNGETLYRADYTGRKNKLGDTETVQLRLQKGVNTVYCLTVLKDLQEAYGDAWANVDYLAVDDSLKAVMPTETVLTAYDAPYFNLYQQVTEGSSQFLGNAQSALAGYYKLSIRDLTGENIGNVPYFSYTVDVKTSGYYDMTLRFAGENESNTNAFGLLVDGTAHVMPYTYKSGVNPNYKQHDADLSVWLEAGTHTLTVTMQLPADAEAAKQYNYEWTNLVRFTVRGNITVSKEQIDPDLSMAGKTLVEAEDYCVPNYYEKVSEGTKYSGGKAVTNGGGTRQTDAAVQEHLDKKEQSYIEYMIEAPKAGKYEIALGVEIGGYSDGYEPYIWLWVNGQVQKVEGIPVKGIINRLSTTVELAKGTNVIRVIGATKEMNTDKAWIDHDYLLIDSSLKALEIPELTKLEAEDVTYYNHYEPAERKSASGGALMGSSSPSAIMAGVSTRNLSLDNFDAASYLSFTVYAPADGYYTIAGRVHMDKGERYGKLGLLVDSKAYVFGMYQNKWGDQNYAEAAVYLTKGTHVIVATGLLADTFSNMDDVLWIDYDWIELCNGLQLASAQIEPTTATDFTRFEAENYAVGNMYQRNAVYDEMSGGYCNYGNRSVTVQSWEEVEADGLDGSRTPYIKYQINAPEAGTYTVRVGMTYKHNGETEQDYSSLAVVINGQAQEIRLPRFTNNYCKPFPLTLELTLEEGVNQVIFTGVLDDTTAEDSYVNLHYDYLDVTGGLTARQVGQRLEAEASENNGYIVRVQNSASGGSILGEEDWNAVWTNDLTFDNLNMKTYMAMPWVKYNVVAEAAGTYEIGIGFNSGGDIPSDLVFTAISVNEGDFQKVYFTKMSKNCVLVEVELKEGDNTILVTAATKDHLDMPNYPSQADGTNLWIDHDYLDLAPGLSGTAVDERPAWTGDAEADFRLSQASVWGDFTGDDNGEPEGGGVGWIIGVIGVGVLGGVILFFLIFILGKKKKKDKAAVESNN